MLNDGVFKLKQKTLLLSILGILFSVSLSFFALNSPTFAYITKADCEAKGGSWIPGNPNMSTSCNFKYTPANQLKSFSYYTALSSCFRNGNIEGAFLSNQMSIRISAADISNPDKWMGGNTISTGYLIDGQDGEQQCSTMIKPALDMWGYTSNTYSEFLDSIGYSGSAMTCTGSTSYDRTCKPSTGGDVSGDTSGSKMLNAFRTTIKNRAYAGSDPTLNNRPDLVFLRGLYHIEASGACSAQPFKKVSDLNADEKNTYKNNDLGPASQNNGWKDYLIVSLVNSDNWKREDWVYKINPDRFTKFIKLNEKTEGGNDGRTCIVLARESGPNADAVAKDAAQMIANGQNPADKYNGIVTTPGGSSNIGGDGSTNPGDPGTTTTCNIEGLGWILCPVMTFMAGVTDAAYGFVSSLLDVKPLLINGEEQGIYGAWSIMRNIANIAFVIAFLIIIFSQLTSVGVSNYGIKKLLPRLVVAAILANISYWICAVAVDLSNIAGSSMKSLFDSLQANLGIKVGESPFDSGTGWLGFVGGILAAGGVAATLMYLHMSLLIPSLISAVVAIVTVFVVLTLRQALIILLIVIAPLAFVAYLLPNTEELFNKWRKLLMTLLLMYPIIAGIFGASALASQVVMGSSDDFAIDVMGALISILPLAITPLVMKFAGGVLNRFGGIVNNVDKGPIDYLKKRGESYRTATQNNRAAEALKGKRFIGAGYFRRKSRREFRDTAAKDALSAGNAAFSITDQTAGGYAQTSSSSQLATSAINTARNNTITNGLAVNGNQNVLNAMGSEAAANEEIKKALAAQTSKAVSAAIEDVKLSANISPGDLGAMSRQFGDAVKNGDSITARAMQDMMLNSGGKGVQTWRESVAGIEAGGSAIGGQVGEDLRKHILDKHPGIKGTDASIMSWATVTDKDTGQRRKLADIQADQSTWGLTNEEFAGQKAFAQHDALNAGAISKERASEIMGNDELMSKIDEGVKIKLRNLSGS